MWPFKTRDNSSKELKNASLEKKGDAGTPVIATKTNKKLKAASRKKKGDAGTPVIKKRYSFRMVMIIVSSLASIVGLSSLVYYLFSNVMSFGYAGVVLGAAGLAALRYYLQKVGDLSTTVIAFPGYDRNPKIAPNCFNLYHDIVVFEYWVPEEGVFEMMFPYECENDNKKYYVNISELKYREQGAQDALKPFILPDQQYYDPSVFAQRVLGLPAHRQIFRRKDKIQQVLKTMFLVIAIIIVWLLILTTIKPA
ncbi:hypothetical protein ACFLTZ_05970 [Chloroflexota bacterium]